MFERLARKITEKTMENVKGVVKEEAFKSADTMFPTVITIVSMGLLLLATVPPQKIMSSQFTINNFYFGK